MFLLSKDIILEIAKYLAYKEWVHFKYTCKEINLLLNEKEKAKDKLIVERQSPYNKQSYRARKILVKDILFQVSVIVGDHAENTINFLLSKLFTNNCFDRNVKIFSSRDVKYRWINQPFISGSKILVQNSELHDADIVIINHDLLRNLKRNYIREIFGMKQNCTVIVCVDSYLDCFEKELSFDYDMILVPICKETWSGRQVCGISLSKLSQLNPHLSRDVLHNHFQAFYSDHEKGFLGVSKYTTDLLNEINPSNLIFHCEQNYFGSVEPEALASW